MKTFPAKPLSGNPKRDGHLAKLEPGDLPSVPERVYCPVDGPERPTVRGLQGQKLIEG